MPDELLVFFQQFCILLWGFGDAVQSSNDSKLIAGRGSVTKAYLQKLCFRRGLSHQIVQDSSEQYFTLENTVKRS